MFMFEPGLDDLIVWRLYIISVHRRPNRRYKPPSIARASQVLMTGDRKKAAADPVAALLDVDRAAYELRRGRLVLIGDEARQSVLAVSAETATE